MANDADGRTWWLRGELAALRAKCDALDDALADETGRTHQENESNG